MQRNNEDAMTTVNGLLSRLAEEDRLRKIPEEPQPGMLDLSSNDYMALGSRCNDFREEFFHRFPDALFSSSASRLLSSHQKYHTALENRLEDLYGRPALLFNSGYHANVGCIGALAALPSTLFVCDKLIHASIVDGLKISAAPFKRFPHNDIAKLRLILEKEYGNYDHVVAVAESVYSMDGDEAPLSQLIALKEDFPDLVLYIDEAHAFGARGARGLGLSEEQGVVEGIDIIIGTFGKAAASAGAFAATSAEIKSLLINCARPFIFSTALPPVNAAWSLFMLEKLIDMDSERRHLADISEYFSRRLGEISGKPTGSTSQIVPLHIGNAAKALAIAAKLKEKGIIALPIRRPTVPPGGERIRFSLTADMGRGQLDSVINTLEDIMHEM